VVGYEKEGEKIVFTMKLKQLVFLFAIIALVSVALTTLFYSFYIVEDVKVVPMDIKVSDHIGFNLDTDSMHFGISTSPGYAGRSFILSHDNEKPLRVEIKIYGEMADWVYIKENSFVLEPNVSKEVKFEVYVPENIEQGHYNGTIKIFFKRVI